MIPSPFYCPKCGAANSIEESVCSVCKEPLVSAEGAKAHEQTELLEYRYHLLVQVGSGGFGAVHKAQDTLSDAKIVAIKQINLRNLSTQEIIEATDGFNREVRLLTDLRHRSLPRIYDSFTRPEHWYIVMDFIEGQTLEEYVRPRFSVVPRGVLPFNEICDIGVQLCDVLGYLHSHEPAVIFRDLKPDNIMRTAGGQLYLIDFGIARLFAPGKLKDTIPLGSPGYAAPEQYGKAQTTPQADIYSLGAVLHYLFSGNDPAENPFHFAPLQLDILSEAENALLNELIQQMVDHNPKQRPASSSKVKERLQSLADREAEQRIWRPSDVILSPYSVASTYYQAIPGGGFRVPGSRRRFLRNVVIVGVSAVALVGGAGLCTAALSRPKFTGSTTWSPAMQTEEVRSRTYMYRGHTAPVTTISWSPDGNYLAAGSVDKTVQVFHAYSGILAYTFKGYTQPVTATAWSSDSMCIVSAGEGDGSAQVWEALSNNNDGTLQGPDGRILALAWAQEKQYIASGGEDKKVRVWDTLHGYKLITTYTGHIADVRTIIFSRDNASVVSGSGDGTIQIWDAITGHLQARVKGHKGGVNSLCWYEIGSEQYIASASDDGTVKIWNVGLRKVVLTFRGHSGKVNCVALFDVYRRNLVVSGGDDTSVRVWDWTTGKEVYRYIGHTTPVRSIATTSTFVGRVASAGEDTSVHVWEWHAG
jgi:serine/threonine protein kinase